MKGLTGAAYEWFNGIQQVAPVCTPRAQPSPNLKWHLDQFSGFCTANSTASLYFTMAALSPSKLSLPLGDLGTHLIHDSLSPSDPTTQTASQ